jgi:hypothetical protein
VAGSLSAVPPKPSGHLSAPAVKAAHDRPLFDIEGARGLTVGKADDVDRHERFTQRLGDLMKRRVHGGPVEGLADRIAGSLNLVDPIPGGNDDRASRASGTDPGVPERLQEIGQILVVAQEARTAQNLLVGVLDEILGVLARPAQPICGAI